MDSRLLLAVVRGLGGLLISIAAIVTAYQSSKRRSY
jgi:hypothetical protein